MFFSLLGITGDVIICTKLMVVVLVQWMSLLNMKFLLQHQHLILEAPTVIPEMKVSYFVVSVRLLSSEMSKL